MKDKKLGSFFSYEVKFVGIGILILFLVMLIITILIGKISFSTFLGSVLGSIYAFVNFIWLEKGLKSAIQNEPDIARKIAVRNYFIRSGVAVIYMFLCFELSFINVFSGVIPLIFPKVILLLGGAFGLLTKGEER